VLDAAAVSVRVVVVAGHVDSSFPAAGAEPPPLRHGRPSRCASARMNYSAIIIIACSRNGAALPSAHSPLPLSRATMYRYFCCSLRCDVMYQYGAAAPAKSQAEQRAE